MKETKFIEQNKEKWKDFEEGFKNHDSNPEKLTHLFVQITDDLSYARTNYPNRSVLIYLNRIAQQVYSSVYKNKTQRWNKWKEFWDTELPDVMYAGRKELLFGFILFVLAFSIGVFSSTQDPQFARQILGDSYVRMTEANIEEGDPMKVYKESAQGDMFLSITLNNLRVAFFCFILGITFGLGTSIFILYNGIMIGAFQFFFIERDLFRESFLTIWVHGTMEVSAIIIAGAAGFILGRSLLFPGTYSRTVSLRIGGIRALKMFMGIAPIIVLAGFFEAYLTRHTEVPDLIRALIIFAELTFMVSYYVILPARKAKKRSGHPLQNEELYPVVQKPIHLHQIKNESTLFSEAINIFRKYTKPITLIAFVASLTFTIAYMYSNSVEQIRTWQWVVAELGDALTIKGSVLLMGIWMAFFTSIHSMAIWLVHCYNHGNKFVLWRDGIRSFPHRKWPLLLLAHAFWLLTLYIPGSISFILFIIGYPIMLLVCIHVLNNSEGKEKSVYSVVLQSTGKLLLLYFFQILTAFLVLQIADSSLALFHLELLKWNVPFDSEIYQLLSTGILTGFMMFIFFLLLPLFVFGISLFYFNMLETVTARDLMNRLKERFA